MIKSLKTGLKIVKCITCWVSYYSKHPTTILWKINKILIKFWSGSCLCCGLFIDADADVFWSYFWYDGYIKIVCHNSNRTTRQVWPAVLSVCVVANDGAQTLALCSVVTHGNFHSVRWCHRGLWSINVWSRQINGQNVRAFPNTFTL